METGHRRLDDELVSSTSAPARRTQAERRESSRVALLDAAARSLSRHGYGSLSLERVAHDAGYTRGALYHQFAGKEELALAVLWWVSERWQAELGPSARREGNPLAELVTLARGHVVYCRDDIARVRMALAVEFSDRDHPIGHALGSIEAGAVARFAKLVNDARRQGLAPPGPPAKATGAALLGALEGLAIQLTNQAPHDLALAERLVLGLLGVSGRAKASVVPSDPPD